MGVFIDKQDRLLKIKDQIINDPLLSEMSSHATQLVFGSGNVDSDIVFIGEAPGKKEDQTGRPFVGASGKFLDEMLRSIEINRSNVYITNIVKYRLPGNRDPLPEEKAAFLPYLNMQLLTIRPRIIVTLGRHAASVFIPEVKISEDHGKLKTITISSQAGSLELLLLALYHPAAALYNGSKRDMLIKDFSLIANASFINKRIKSNHKTSNLERSEIISNDRTK